MSSLVITLNGYTVNDASNPATVAWIGDESKGEGIQGLENPTARTSTGDYAGRDGGWIGAQYFSPRNITIMGHIFSPQVALHEAGRAALQNSVTSQSITVGITTPAGSQYTILANYLDLQMPYSNMFRSSFKLELFAKDPILYATGSNQTINISPSLSGGVVWPIVWPLTYSAGTTPVTVVNSGAVNIYPTITLTGSMTNPILTNLTTGYFMSLGVVTGTGDNVAIKMAPPGSILLDGSSIYGDQQAGSSFWYLAPGNNSVQLTTGSTSDTVTGSISWQAGVMGI